MTINIAVLCRDGIVLACDSLASEIHTVLLPGTGTPLHDLKTGNPVLDPNSGQHIIPEGSLRRQETIVNTFGNVNKLFQLKDYPAGILISGLGQIGEETFDDIIDEFNVRLRSQDQMLQTNESLSIEKIANDMAAFLDTKFQAAYPGTIVPLQPLNVLMAGFQTNNRKPKLYEIQTPGKRLTRKVDDKNPYSLTFAGQGDAIERFMQGFSNATMNQIAQTFAQIWKQSIMGLAKDYPDKVKAYLKDKGINISEEIANKIPKLSEAELQLQMQVPMPVYNVAYQHMSLQDAVDFCVFLSTLTYGRQRFVSGIPTVGGRLNIATITRKEGYRYRTPQEINVIAVQI